MNTVTLTPEAYRIALLSANKVKTSVEDWVNRVLLNFVATQTTAATTATTTKPSKMAAEGHAQTYKADMYTWEEMEGMFATDKSDSELLDEYLAEKYGL